MPAAGQVSGVAPRRKRGERLLQQQCDRRQRREHERETLTYDEARGADRQHEQGSQAARHAAARVGQQRNREHIDACADERLHRDVRPAPFHGADRQDGEKKVTDRRAHEEARLRLTNRRRRHRHEQDAQQQRRQQPKQVDEREHPPGKLGRRRPFLGRCEQRFHSARARLAACGWRLEVGTVDRSRC